MMRKKKMIPKFCQNNLHILAIQNRRVIINHYKLTIVMEKEIKIVKNPKELLQYLNLPDDFYCEKIPENVLG